MAKRFLLEPKGVCKRLSIRYRNQCHHWLVGAGEWPIKEPLGVPTQQQASTQIAQVRAWQASWADWDNGGEVVWADRRWSFLGTQRLPEALLIDSAETVAKLIGKEHEWIRVCHRFQEVSGRWPVLNDVLPSFIKVLAEWEEPDFNRLMQVIDWLEANPDSDLYIRQLPIPGVDSKWLESRQSVVCDWLSRILGVENNRDLYTLAGLKRLPLVLRFRLLDPKLRARMGGLGDMQVPVKELASLQLPIERVFIVENLQTGLAFDDIPGALVFMKQGYAVELFERLTWLSGLPCYYWGDIDTHGFAILNRLRHYLPDIRSLLMDSGTLLKHRKLWGCEEKTANAELDRLTPEEKALYGDLRDDRWDTRVRLEQERIDWQYASGKLFSEVSL